MELTEKLRKAKRMLVMVDVIEDFTRMGIYANPYGVTLIPEIKRLINLFLNSGDVVVSVSDWHPENSTEVMRLGEHGMEETVGASIVKEFQPFANQIITIKKNSTCAVVAPGYLELIDEAAELVEIVFVGLLSNMCVPLAAIPTHCYLDQKNRYVKVIVPENAIDTFDAPGHSRDEWNEIGKRFMQINGVEIVKKYERK